MSQEFITIGHITRVHGVKGEVRVLPLTDFPERFSILKKVYVLLPEGERRRVEVVSTRPHKSFFILKFKGIDRVEEAETLKDGILQVEFSERFPLPEGYHYLFEIVGCQVFTESGDLIGRVLDVVRLESNDVYVVEGDQGEVLIPAIKDVVKHIDVRAKEIIIYPMEGLL